MIKKYRDQRIRFIGGVYDKNILNNLRHFSKIYFHGHSVGGTNPSLLEAMACGCRIAAHANMFNQAILQNEADYFSNDKDVSEILNNSVEEQIIDQRTQINLQKIRSVYNWDRVVNEYEQLMLQLCSKRH
jgi:glycosyltransferase involved in cell wall biosynthesis